MQFKYEKLLHQQLLLGEKIAVGWGVPSDLLFKIKQAPYSFEFLIDGTKKGINAVNSELGVPVFGTDKIALIDKSQYVIIVLADLKQYGPQILKQIAQFGLYTVTTPYCPWLEQNSDVKIKEFVNKYKAKTAADIGLSKNGRPKNIALMIYGFTRGGAEWQFYLLARTLAKQGHNVSIFYLIEPVDTTKCWLQELSSLGVSLFCLADYLQVVYSPKHEGVVNEMLAFMSVSEIRLVLVLMSLMSKQKIDSCVSYLLSANVLASLSALLIGIKNTLISTRCLAPNTQQSDLADVKNVINTDLNTKSAVLEALVKYAGLRVGANSQTGADSYAKWLNIAQDLISVVPNGLHPPPVINKQSLRHSLNIACEEFLVVGVMRLIERKRPLLFIECVAALNQCGINVKVLLIGSGDLMPEIQQFIESKGLSHIVRLLGEKANVTDFMQVADVLLHTSEFEGLPNVILEAQQVGCPVVSSNAGGCAEALAPEVRSLCLVKSTQPDDFVKKIMNFKQQKNVEFFRLHAKTHIQHMTLENLANNTLIAAGCNV